MWSRRTLLLTALAAGACSRQPESNRPADDPRFAEIEQRIGGRVGVAALNTQTGAWLLHRAGERYAMCSTFKWLLAANFLFIDQHQPNYLAREVEFDETDLLDYAPVAREHLARGRMTVEELCAGAVVMSDNTCANLLIGEIFGPQNLNLFLRANGDEVTRLDRTEPDLNEAPPGDQRDTTTPEAMVETMQRLLLTDDPLNAASREKLIGWMVASPTGRERLRAGLPAGWRVGDKTGTWNGTTNATNDVAIAWPPGRDPILIACYLRASTAEPAARNAAHAEIARIIAGEWS